jgi:lipopolysaccharide export system protein LptC
LATVSSFASPLVSPVEERDMTAFALRRPGDRARAFRVARRHSRQVRILRLLIPGSIAGSIAVAMLIAELDPLRMLTKLPLDFGSLVVSGNKITMQQPRIAGFTRDGRAYELTARAAAQDVTKPDTIELQGVSGSSEMADKTVFHLSAANGVFDTKAEMLTLRQDVVLKSSAGLAVYLSEAVVDVHSGNVVSEKPVAVKMPTGTVNANRLEVAGSGDIIRFDGDVTMMLSSGGHFVSLGGNRGVP